MKDFIEIMDTTLRDGEQTSGVSFRPNEKLAIAKFFLEKLNVNRIEVASAHVSSGELKSVRKICKWASDKNRLESIEVLGFVDFSKSVDWIVRAGGKVMNLLCKGSYNHLKHQLKKTPQNHIEDINRTIEYAQKKGVAVNVYLEDWSNGMKNSSDYVQFIISRLNKMPVRRIMLPDTLGVLYPTVTKKYIKEIISSFPNAQFDFHGHNDYDLAVANSVVAVENGINGLHLTVNGIGERAGNSPLASTVVALKDHLGVRTSVREDQIFLASKLIETFSSLRVSKNKPIIGEYVFTQTAGIHADGDMKNSLYFNDLLPERFGRLREYALGKMSGKANVKKNLQELGIVLTKEELERVTSRVIEIGDKKKVISKYDLPYILSDVLKSPSKKNFIRIESYSFSLSNDKRPTASIKLKIGNKTYESLNRGQGLYDAFMNSIKSIYKTINKTCPKLKDYEVDIPPGGKTDALVETKITWEVGHKIIKTTALDSDQTLAAMKATLKVLNILEVENFDNRSIKSIGNTIKQVN